MYWFTWNRNLALDGKNIIIKTLALWTFVFLPQVLQIPKEITTTIQLKNLKIKHEILCNDFQSGGLKNVACLSKFLAYNAFRLENYTTKTTMTGNWFQCISSIMVFRKTLFLSNLSFKTSLLHQFPTFYAYIFQWRRRNFSYISYSPSCIGHQVL